MPPETRYARSGDVDIAYQVVGDGPIDLVVIPGWVSNVEVYWEEPSWARFTERLASFARVILFDKRGTGLSDRVSDLPSLEVRMEDLIAVMDTVGSSRSALFGWSEGGPMAALFAATYPIKTHSLIMAGAFARRLRAPDYPWGPTADQIELMANETAKNWGTGIGMEARSPSKLGDRQYEMWRARFQRQSASPNAAVTLLRMNALVDIRRVLPVISVPTLVLHSLRDPLINIEEGRYLARNIPNAKLVEYDSIDHLPYLQGSDVVLDEIEVFLTGVKGSLDYDRILATVMFTDIVGATDKASELGDRAWRDLLQAHHNAIRRELHRFRGKEIDTAGDGFFAAFDGPARAIRCAKAAIESVRNLGLSIRVGIHTGECEVIGEKYGGIAVHTGARVSAQAAAGEVLVTGTVKDLVAGSGLAFADRGECELKGIRGTWHLYSVD
jgi:pimeloyl-ACP methyl ester carboxylesterase